MKNLQNCKIFDRPVVFCFQVFNFKFFFITKQEVKTKIKLKSNLILQQIQTYFLDWDNNKYSIWYKYIYDALYWCTLCTTRNKSRRLERLSIKSSTAWHRRHLPVRYRWTFRVFIQKWRFVSFDEHFTPLHSIGTSFWLCEVQLIFRFFFVDRALVIIYEIVNLLVSGFLPFFAVVYANFRQTEYLIWNIRADSICIRIVYVKVDLRPRVEPTGTVCGGVASFQKHTVRVPVIILTHVFKYYKSLGEYTEGNNDLQMHIKIISRNKKIFKIPIPMDRLGA